MIARFLGAIQFLTIVPVRQATATAGASALFFPLLGGAIGCAGAILFVGLREILPIPVAAVIVLAFWAAVTGGLHEDGLADVADAFRAGRSRERILSILKDSRIGAHGAVALILFTALRLAALSALIAPSLMCLAAIFAVSRAAVVALAWLTPPVGAGLGWQFSQDLTSATSIAVLVQVAMVAAVTPTGALLLWGVCLIVLAAKVYFSRRIGGVTGDCLGATAFVVETWGLVLYSCQRCM
jgi:adenosylcobinamide-GDP ribazoletransferase